MIIAWSLLIYVGYNVLTVEATTDLKEIQKEMCEVNYEADWKDGKCHFSVAGTTEYNDEGEYLADLRDTNQEARDDYVERQEERAADEDAKCDDEDADTTDVKECMSEKREQQASHNYDKESCEQVNGDWNKKKNSGCTFYEDEQQDILDAAEDQRRIIDEEEQQALAAIDEYNAAQEQQQPEVIEDWSNTVTPDTNNDNEITPEEAESYVAEY